MRLAQRHGQDHSGLFPQSRTDQGCGAESQTLRRDSPVSMAGLCPPVLIVVVSGGGLLPYEEKSPLPPSTGGGGGGGGQSKTVDKQHGGSETGLPRLEISKDLNR
jgi:hypothetical protein